MLPPGGSGSRLPRELLPIGIALVLMVGIVSVYGPRLAYREPDSAHPILLNPADPIPAEALVFRLVPSDLAVSPEGDRRATAHPRTLATYQSLRAYPGAPPRIPHGLTEGEYRRQSCNTCHERGGYAERFAAYAPVTPHPEYENCLQCHLPDDIVVGSTFPDARPNGSCFQCHVAGSQVPVFVPTDWHPAGWPETDQRAMMGSPPLIPHDLQLRGNCLACHTGPGGVEEIRSTHPERANCRQCHLPTSTETPLFTRPLDGMSADLEQVP